MCKNGGENGVDDDNDNGQRRDCHRAHLSTGSVGRKWVELGGNTAALVVLLISLVTRAKPLNPSYKCTGTNKSCCFYTNFQYNIFLSLSTMFYNNPNPKNNSAKC